LAEGLRQHGIDAKTTIELGLSGVSDEAQLQAARDEGRVLVTNNICDFVPLHERWIAEEDPTPAPSSSISRCSQSVKSFGDWPSWFTHRVRKRCETGSNG
jgi:hypothetical protein